MHPPSFAFWAWCLSTTLAPIPSAPILPGQEEPLARDDFPFVYVVFADGGKPLARAIVSNGDSCPTIHVVGMDPQPDVRVRATGTTGMPHDFPVRVCEAQLARETLGGTFGSRKLPAVTTDPKVYLLVGDTGLRVKGDNNGTCMEYSKTKKLYDIPVCVRSGDFDPQRIKGEYQDLENWPLDSLMAEAAQAAPDVVVHFGDYLYRQGPCALSKGCADINLHGNWGDNWRGWAHDLFVPARPLMEAAPWIVVRGNHENCLRGGHGWFLFLDPSPLPYDWGTNYCSDFADVYAVPFKNEQFLVMDDSVISPMNGGIDHMDFQHSCPGPIPRTAEATSRYWDPKQNSRAIEADIAYFMHQFTLLKALAKQYATNIYVSHRPLFAVACNGTNYVTLDWTMQEAQRRVTGSLDRVSLAVSGHIHWFEGLEFKNWGHPVQLVVGNSGTKLIPNTVPQRELKGDWLKILGHTVSKGVTSSHFGYVTVCSHPHHLKVAAVDIHHPGTEQDKVFWKLAVPRGPRIVKAHAMMNRFFEIAAEMGLLWRMDLLWSAFIALVIARGMNSVSAPTLSSWHLDASIVRFLASVLQLCGVCCVIWSIAKAIGFDDGTNMVLTSIIGGLATQDALVNLASGLMLIATRPFQVGDKVELRGIAGFVSSIGYFQTHFVSAENKGVCLPNSLIVGGVLTNYSRSFKHASPGLGLLRVNIPVYISVKSDLEEALEAVNKAGEAIDSDVKRWNADEQLHRYPIGVLSLADFHRRRYGLTLEEEHTHCQTEVVAIGQDPSSGYRLELRVHCDSTLANKVQSRGFRYMVQFLKQRKVDLFDPCMRQA